jgi:hypothetical protein
MKILQKASTATWFLKNVSGKYEFWELLPTRKFYVDRVHYGVDRDQLPVHRKRAFGAAQLDKGGKPLGRPHGGETSEADSAG